MVSDLKTNMNTIQIYWLSEDFEDDPPPPEDEDFDEEEFGN